MLTLLNILSVIRQHAVKLVISLVIAAVFAALLRAATFDLIPKGGIFSGVEWWALVGYFVLFSLVHVVRAARWTFLLKPLHDVSMNRILATSFVGFAAIVIMPMRAGEIVRAALIRKKGHITGWAATGTIGAERVIDGLVLTVMLLLGLAMAKTLDPLPDHIGELPISARIVPVSAYGALLLFVCAFIAMALFYFARDKARQLTLTVVGLVSEKWARWIARRIEQVTDGLNFLPDVKLSSLFVLVTTGYWLVNSAATWVLAQGCGFHDFSYAQACVTTGVLALGILVPNAPGFIGAFQFSIYAAFAMFYPVERIYAGGPTYVFWAFVLQNAVTVVAALIGGLMLRTGVSEVIADSNKTLDLEA